MSLQGVFIFFFQAEDGIRDIGVTGVQTCALPIYRLANGISYVNLALSLNVGKVTAIEATQDVVEALNEIRKIISTSLKQRTRQLKVLLL